MYTEVGKGSPRRCYLNSDGSVRETQIGVDGGSLPGTEDGESGASDCVGRPAVARESQEGSSAWPVHEGGWGRGGRGGMGRSAWVRAAFWRWRDS